MAIAGLKMTLFAALISRMRNCVMSLLTARYALGVGLLREALSQLVANGHRGESRYRVASMSEAELSIFLTRAPIWKRCWYARAIERGDDARGGGVSRERICSVNWKPAMPVNICSMNGISATVRSISAIVAGCGPLPFVTDARTLI